MKLLLTDFKKGLVKLRLTNPEDYWHLSQIINAGDIISGKTVRKVTVGTERTTHVQKPVFLKNETERTELANGALRVSGKILEGPEDISRGSYHTFTLEQDTDISVEKEWLSIHKAQLKEAEHDQAPIIVCVFDRDDATIARTSQKGMVILAQLRGDPERKEKRANTRTDLYTEIIALLQQYDTRFAPQHIILASPAFYKEDLFDRISDKKLREKITLATCSSSGENAIHEVLRRPETQHALRQVRAAHETEIVDKLLTALAKQSAATYGFEHVKAASEAGAISDILVTFSYMKKLQESGKFQELNLILKHIERLNGTIHLISAEHDAGKKLDGLGGIAALLRYKLEW